jgi:hypothetical protein
MWVTFDGMFHSFLYMVYGETVILLDIFSVASLLSLLTHKLSELLLPLHMQLSSRADPAMVCYNRWFV